LQQRTLPVFDPSPTGPDAALSTVDYLELARCQRRRWASWVMELWTRSLLDPFYRGIPNPGPGGATSAKMSALYWIWEIYTCGQLNKLLDQEYYATNVPHVYSVPNNAFNGAAGNCQTNLPGVYDCGCLEIGNGVGGYPGYRGLMLQNVNQQQSSYLEQYHTFVGVTYWPRMSQTSPAYFRYPLTTDATAFAQVSVFIPQARYTCCPWAIPIVSGNPPEVRWQDNYDPWPGEWDVTNQNWIAKLAPATSDSVVMILQSPLAQPFALNVRTPNLGGLSPYAMRQINTH
jgi:hypothetical protein